MGCRKCIFSVPISEVGNSAKCLVFAGFEAVWMGLGLHPSGVAGGGGGCGVGSGPPSQRSCLCRNRVLYLYRVVCAVLLVTLPGKELGPFLALIHSIPFSGQHKHPLPPPTNVPFKLVWALENYVEANEKVTAAEIWPKVCL